MKTALIRSAACLVFLSAPAVEAQPVPASVRGRVVAAENDRVLPRARVALIADGRPGEAVFADDRGRFTIPLPNMVAGSSRTDVLAVTKAGYAIQHVMVPASAKDVTIALSRAVSISGRVVDSSGEGAVEVRVVAQRQDAAPDAPGPTKFETTTDDLGEYRLGGLPAGRYEVSVQVPDPSGVTFRPGGELELRPGDEIAAINFSVPARERFTFPPREAAPGPVQRQTGTGTITGRVTSASGRPLDRARVQALQNGLTPRGAQTDSQGRFTIAQLPAGAYTLQASRDGYVTIFYGQARVSQPGKPLIVRDGEAVGDADIVLPRGTAITGTIVDEHGEPLQGVSVRAMQLREASGRTAALAVGPRNRSTDDRGRYRVYGLLPGSYLIEASVNASISGAGSRGYAPVFYPGTIQPGEASPITADLGRDVPAIDLVLTQTPASRVTGIVRTSDGAAFTGPVLMMASQRSGGIAVEPQRPAQAPDGSFVFTNVPPGDYVVQAMRAREQNRGMSEFGAQFVVVTDGAPKPIVITTAPGATWTGRTVFEGDGATRSAMEQAPSVMPFPIDFDRAPAIGGGTYSSSTGPDGSFSMSGLFGPTRFRLMGRQDTWYLKSITIGGLDITDAPYDFGASQTITGAEVIISNAGASISGHVTDAASAPVDNYSVVVFPTDRSKWFVTSRFLRLVRPTQDGSFEVTGLPPGEYWLAATDPFDGNEVSGDWLKTETLERLAFRATRVTLEERDRFITVLRLIRR